MTTEAEWYVTEFETVGCCTGADNALALDCNNNPCIAYNDEIIAESLGNTIHTTHFNATYNCCPDDIAVAMTGEGNMLRLMETEIITVRCKCDCCYTVEAEIGGVAPGEYTVEYCWNPRYPVCDTVTVVVSQ